MKSIPYFVSMLFLLLGPNAQAQQSVDLSGAVYSAFLHEAITLGDSLLRYKHQSVVVIPARKAEWSKFEHYGLTGVMTPVKLTSKDTVQASDPSADGKPALTMLALPVGMRIRRPGSAFGDWLRADTALAIMGRKFDAKAHNAPVVADSLSLPGYIIKLETPDFFRSQKWRDWGYFYRKNRRSYGVVSLSDIVFSADARYAVFYAGIHQGSLNGVGYYVFMEKSARGWRTKFTRMLWIS